MNIIKYHHAAYAYVGSALLSILLTLILGGTPERFRAEAPFLLIGLPIILFIGYLIYTQHKWITRIFAIFAGIRATLFFLNSMGIQPHFDFRNFQMEMNRISSSLHLLFLINGIAVGIAVYLMARAGWSNN
ncbi:hypothetical protein IIA15_02400 [candidate division TA06 bacterium]|nr:hypothetical protein [candidate division TA06 bacterium]